MKCPWCREKIVTLEAECPSCNRPLKLVSPHWLLRRRITACSLLVGCFTAGYLARLAMLEFLARHHASAVVSAIGTFLVTILLAHALLWRWPNRKKSLSLAIAPVAVAIGGLSAWMAETISVAAAILEAAGR